MPPSTYALAVPAALYQEAPPPWVLPPQPARDPTVGRYLHAKSAPTPTVEHEYELAEHAHRAATALGARGRREAAGVARDVKPWVEKHTALSGGFAAGFVAAIYT